MANVDNLRTMLDDLDRSIKRAEYWLDRHPKEQQQHNRAYAMQAYFDYVLEALQIVAAATKKMMED